jgi:lipopolysaccharide export LptBFGC system permease protein LptF
MISEDVQRVELEARKRSLEEYKLRCQDLRSENEALKSEKDQREADALQIISFLRRDAERKDELIESLKGTINQQREIFAQQREEERQQTAAKMQAQEVDFKQIEGRLRAQLDAVQSELRELTEFKEQKTALEEKLEQGASDRADLEGEHKETVAAMERRFFEEKARLQKEYAAQFGAIMAQLWRNSAQSF